MKGAAALFATLSVSLLLFSTLPSLVSSTAQCLYCRRSDFTATLLVSYAYCQSSDTCLQDRWLYIDRPCTGGWKRGVNTMLDDCTPKKTTCHPFVSTEAANGVWFNFTETLGANEYCEIVIDATANMGRVVLDDALTVGAQYLATPDASYNSTL